MDDIYIYILIDPITSEIRYVGKTVNIKQRYRQHCKGIPRMVNGIYKPNKCCSWIMGLKKAGLKPTIEVIDLVDDIKYEGFYISMYKDLGFNLLNMTSGGDGPNKGNIPWNKGRKGVQKSWNKGLRYKTGKTNKHSEETKLKISKTKSGISSPKKFKSIYGIDREGNRFEFESIKAASIFCGGSFQTRRSNIQRNIGTNRYTYGYKWEYK